MSDENEIRNDQPEAEERQQAGPTTAADTPAKQVGRDDDGHGQEAIGGKVGDAGAGSDGFALAPRTGRLAVGLAAVASLLGAAALVAAGSLWLTYRRAAEGLQAADGEQRVAIESTTERLARLTRAVESVNGDLSTNRDRIEDLQLRIGDFTPQFNALAQRVDALQGGPIDGREVWLEAEAEYYLAIANAELMLSGRVGTAMTALGLADELLRELADPALNPVRVAIAEELASLRGTAVPDYEGIASGLAGLAGRVESLPLRGGSTDAYAGDAPELDDMAPGFGRLWESLRRSVLSIVRVERRDAPIEPLLTAAERQLVTHELVLELQLARIALLRSDSGSFRASLAAAEALLERDFDVDTASVRAALAQLREMRALDIAPQWPDISRSLNLLRSAAGGTG